MSNAFCDQVGVDCIQIDRHNAYRALSGLFFPHHENPMRPLGNTVVDGELVLDVDPQTKKVGRMHPCAGQH